MRHDWRHRTKVYKQGPCAWNWRCLNPNCLVERVSLDQDTAFRKAAMHTWVGGYRNTETRGES